MTDPVATPGGQAAVVPSGRAAATPGGQAAVVPTGRTMVAAVFHGGTDIRITRVPVPAVEPDEVLVEVVAAGICGSDLLAYRGLGPWQHDPAHPDGDGHELSGRIAAVGAAVTGFAVGDRVAVEPIHLLSCGHCALCRAGRGHLCAERGMRHGVPVHSRGFAEYDVAPASQLHPLPDHVGLAEAALLDCYACGVHALHLVALPPGAPVAVLGSGAIGQTLGQLARAAGHPVSLLGHRAATLDVALGAGAASTVWDTSTAAGRRARDAAAGTFPVVFDAAGSGGSLTESLRLVTPGGEVVVLGVHPGPPGVDPQLAYRREATLRWSNSYGACLDGVPDFRRARDLLAEGAVDAAALITHRLPLARLPDGFRTLADRDAGAVKVMVTPGGGGT
ncbi:zinc-dependent alcohol dehydrogenase [Plantactinospora sp. WMMB334]|uniref:zinc-dependent alcohol dehydrogenase n=1 Tax=Plantactinospora sp. WMMB334 TaxID=3404119 RepID=UPI003B93FE08